MADKVNSSDLKICSTHVASMLHHRQSSISVDPKIFDMTFQGNVMNANSQVVVLSHADPSVRSSQKSFQFVIV